jgi:hypothetical protein
MQEFKILAVCTRGRWAGRRWHRDVRPVRRAFLPEVSEAAQQPTETRVPPFLRLVGNLLASEGSLQSVRARLLDRTRAQIDGQRVGSLAGRLKDNRLIVLGNDLAGTSGVAAGIALHKTVLKEKVERAVLLLDGTARLHAFDDKRRRRGVRNRGREGDERRERENP